VIHWLSLESGGLVSNAKVLHATAILHKTGVECVDSGRSTCDLNSDCNPMFSPRSLMFREHPAGHKRKLSPVYCLLHLTASYQLQTFCTGNHRIVLNWGSAGLFKLIFSLKIVRNLIQNIIFLR
jgi:hypothetical protein